MEQKRKDGPNQVIASSCISANQLFLQVQIGQRKLICSFFKKKGHAEILATSQHFGSVIIAG